MATDGAPSGQRQGEGTEMAMETCLRCGAEYAEGAVVCFTCGAPIGEISTPTQPVAAVRAIPPKPLVAAIEQTAPAQPAPKPSRAPLSPAARRKRRALILRVSLLIVTFALAATGVTLGVRALLASAPISQRTAYQDPAHRFRFTRPTLWNVSTSPTGVLLSDSGGTSTLHVTVRTPLPKQTATDAADTLAKDLTLATALDKVIGGSLWEQRTGKQTGSDGAVRQLTVYVTIHAGQLYVIETTSPIATAATIDNLVYEPLFASFQFA